MKRLLIVSPHFPPVNAPDMQRARTLLPHLAAQGWEARVLAVDPRDVDAPRDDSLALGLPSAVRVERCRAWPLRLTRKIGLRTLGWRAWRALDQRGAEIIRDWRPDMVLFTTTQYLLTTLGPRWRRKYGTPYVVDLQDPWVTDFYARPGSPRPPGGWKYRLARMLAAKLEPRVFRQASGFVSVSPSYLEQLANRYSWFGNKPGTTIPFGVDAAEFEHAVKTSAPAFHREPGCLHLVSVGAVGEIMAPAVLALCRELQALRMRSPETLGRLRVHFIGTSYAPADLARPSVSPLAATHGLEDVIREDTRRVPWAVAQATMRASDGLIILTNGAAGYTPSKLAGCFLADRPSLLVAAADSGAARLNEELGLGLRLDPLQAGASTLDAFLQETVSPDAPWRRRRRDDRFANHHTAQARSRELLQFLDTQLLKPN